MTYASLAAQRSNYIRHQNTVSFSGNKTKLGPISNFVVLLVLACLLAVIYLSQVIRTNNYSYSLNALTEQKSNLEKDTAALEVQSARLQSIERISDSQVAANLVEPSDVKLIN
ncbi:hypothetical protein KC878_00675 [Candidatus Saccharibacteria bacterium]|nr:hypothetical protein [Candidatus Saccharibacteria bacterium]MCB9821385.1 hypothetical protein [Candidatus Nomurabacteria bacterium]